MELPDTEHEEIFFIDDEQMDSTRAKLRFVIVLTVLLFAIMLVLMFVGISNTEGKL